MTVSVPVHPVQSGEHELPTPIDAADIADKWDKVLHALGEGLSLTAAARYAGTTTQTIKARRLKDKDFDAACAEGYESGTDALEDEAFRRGLKSSDYILWQMLKARRRQVYGDKVQIDTRQLVITTNLDFGVVERFDEVVRNTVRGG